MSKLLIATHNKGKINEFKNFLSGLPLQLVSLDDIGIYEDIDETGNTYFENSQLKATFYTQKSGLPALSDDGGLEIDALGGAPGVKSRRWLGYEAKDEELIEYMKKVAAQLPDENRGAAFKVVLTLAMPNGEIFQEFSEVRGVITKKPLLSILEGYPYRSFFYLPEIGKYYHEDELTDEEMKLYNHRYKAVERLKSKIANKL